MRAILALVAASLLTLGPAGAADDLAREHARQILAKTDDGTRYFAIGDRGDLVHAQSGLACRQQITGSATVVLRVLDRAEGKDVSCDYLVGTFGRFTVFATRMPPGLSAEGLFPVVQSALIQDVTDPRPQQPPAPIRVTDAGLGLDVVPLSASYQTVHQGRYFTVSVWLAVVDGWAVKLHGAYVVTDKPRGEALAADMLGWAVRSVKAAAGS